MIPLNIRIVKKGSKLYSIINLKCPRCHEAPLFVSPVKTFGDLFDMPKNCPNCQQAYFLEIGFYWGAMYTAYAISSALCFIFFFLAYFLFGFSLMGSCAFFAIVVLLISPSIFRMSRAMWINFFVKYNKNAVAKKNDTTTP